MVMITAPDRDTGLRVARALVDARLAACVNVVDRVTSVFHWEGKVQEEGEVLLIAKTTRERFEALRELALAEHPYDVPEIIALEIADGAPAYLDWIASSVSVGS